MRILLSFVILMLSLQTVQAQVVLQKSANIAGHYIVSFVSKERPVLGRNSAKSQRQQQMISLRAELDEHLIRLQNDLSGTDLKITHELWLRQEAAITLSPRYEVKLRTLSYVLDVRADQQYRAEKLAALPLSGEVVSADIARIDIDTLWSEGYRGQGVVVAVLDSGVDYRHVDLRDRWRGGTNSWLDTFGDFDLPDDVDYEAHGTGVTSVVLGGKANESGEYLGVAPNAQWIAARVLKLGNTSESNIRDALQWILDPDKNALTDDAPDIVQNSWGLSSTEGGCDKPFETELTAIDAAGIDIVFAVGNSGGPPNGPATYSSYLTPSFDPHVISVGAIKVDNTILGSSSRGPDKCNSEIIPSLVAPGQAVIVANSTSGGLSFALDDTHELSGTSFASPMVSGALALLRSKFQADDHLEFRQALYDSTTQLGATSPNDDFGRGLVQASAAADVLQAATTATTPTVSLRASEVNFSMAKYVFAENISNPVVSVTVLRSGDISSAASVRVISTNGTAVSGSDYVAVDETVNFLENESQKTIEITLIDDFDAEGDETFTLNFSVPYTNVTPGSRALPIVIADDEQAAQDSTVGGGSVSVTYLLLMLSLLCSGLMVRQLFPSRYLSA